jgi:hypothetical protein
LDFIDFIASNENKTVSGELGRMKREQVFVLLSLAITEIAWSY